MSNETPKPKTHSIQYFLILFCSVTHRLKIVIDILLESFYENFYMTREDTQRFKKNMRETKEMDHDHVLNLFIENVTWTKRIHDNSMSRELNKEIVAFYDVTFFDHFFLNINHVNVEKFLKDFVCRINRTHRQRY